MSQRRSTRKRKLPSKLVELYGLDENDWLVNPVRKSPKNSQNVSASNAGANTIDTNRSAVDAIDTNRSATDANDINELGVEDVVVEDSSEDLPPKQLPHVDSTLNLRPYLERGKEKIVRLDAVLNGDQLLTKDDDLKITCKSGATVMGRVTGMYVKISCGSELFLCIRIYQNCKILDPYVDCDDREVCLVTPFTPVEISAPQILFIYKLRVVKCEEDLLDSNTILFRRAYDFSTHNWCSLEHCLRQEAVDLSRECQSSEEESEAEQTPGLTLSPDVIMLKHSVESDFVPRGFVDFLANEGHGTQDEQHFIEHIDSKYIDPIQQVGRELNPGRELIKNLSMSGKFFIQELTCPVCEKCVICSTVTHCGYAITEDLLHWKGHLSKGCAQRLIHLHALRKFLSDNQNKYTALTRQLVFDLNNTLQQLLYKIDRCLDRPIKV